MQTHIKIKSNILSTPTHSPTTVTDIAAVFIYSPLFSFHDYECILEIYVFTLPLSVFFSSSFPFWVNMRLRNFVSCGESKIFLFTQHKMNLSIFLYNVQVKFVQLPVNSSEAIHTLTLVHFYVLLLVYILWNRIVFVCWWNTKKVAFRFSFLTLWTNNKRIRSFRKLKNCLGFAWKIYHTYYPIVVHLYDIQCMFSLNTNIMQEYWLFCCWLYK